MSRAIHDEDFEIDVNYYLTQQVHPVVSRLIEQLPGTDARSIAEFLGLDASFVPTKAVDSLQLMVEAGKDRFDLCKSLTFKCPNSSCRMTVELREPMEGCPHCQVSFLEEKNGSNIVEQFTQTIQEFVEKFNAGWVTCQDQTCGKKMRLKPGDTLDCPDCLSAMFVDFPASQMHFQLSFFESIVSPKAFKQNTYEEEKSIAVDSREKPKVKGENEPFSLKNSLAKIIVDVKKSMTYSTVNMGDLFSTQIFMSLRKK